MELNPGALDHLFESTVKLEETHLEEGYREGFADGVAAGKEEARQVGLSHGFGVGEELGFYRGCADVWISAVRVDPAAFSARVQKGIKQIEELLEKHPGLDPEDECAQEVMEALRLKFRAVSASLGVRLEYEGHPKAAAARETEF